MTAHRHRIKYSAVAALCAAGFFTVLVRRSAPRPDFYYALADVGLVLSTLFTIVLWRLERRPDAKAAQLGMWIIFVVLLVYIFLCLCPFLAFYIDRW
jgi:hypothetical protein